MAFYLVKSKLKNNIVNLRYDKYSNYTFVICLFLINPFR